MGFCASKPSLPQVLLAGLDDAGKTTFLLADVVKSVQTIESTYGFNYQEKVIGDALQPLCGVACRILKKSANLSLIFF